MPISIRRFWASRAGWLWSVFSFEAQTTNPLENYLARAAQACTIAAFGKP